MKKPSGIDWLILAFLALFLIQTLVSAFFSLTVFLIFLTVFLLSAAVILIFRKDMRRSVGHFLFYNTKDSEAQKSLFNRTDMPVMICSKNNEIIWCNSAFMSSVAGGRAMLGTDCSEVLGESAMNALDDIGSAEISYNNKLFLVYRLQEETNSVCFFVDHTSLKRTATEFQMSRPAVAIAAIDSLDDATRGMRESERINIAGTIQNIIEKWFSPAQGIIANLSNDRFLLVMNERNLKAFEEDRFSVLKSIREYDFGENIRMTLSIGVGRGGPSIRFCEELAMQALDMALGRGGDQVVIKPKSGDYKFYGGVKGATEKRARVRTRIIASALQELINGSENVIIMGHKYSDLDCLGAAYAIYSKIREDGRNAYIALNRKETLASPLLEYIENNDSDCRIIGEEEAMRLVTKRTLLIVFDTHRPKFVDFENVLNACKLVVVIDHHRKAVDYIENPVVFYHETAASSACEMTAELLQYIDSGSIGRIQADALLSGIMLDTKNFVLHTGVRTFEAAAFLRKSGADPIAVKKLFSGTMPLYRNRVKIASSAELKCDCAIAINDIENEDTRIATSQAADELLNIDGIRASFVICKTGAQYNISARSLGEINVQLIMERLGGGGHRTMAACQLDCASFDEAKKTLVSAIDEYKKSI